MGTVQVSDETDGIVLLEELVRERTYLGCHGAKQLTVFPPFGLMSVPSKSYAAIFVLGFGCPYVPCRQVPRGPAGVCQTKELEDDEGDEVEEAEPEATDAEPEAARLAAAKMGVTTRENGKEHCRIQHHI